MVEGIGEKIGIIGSIWSFLKLIAKKWRWIITIFSIIVLLTNSVKLAKEENTIVPIFTEIGIQLINADYVIAKETQMLKASEKPIWKTGEEGLYNIIGNFLSFTFEWLKIIGNIIVKLWFIYISFYLVYKFWNMLDSSSSGKNLLYAFITVCLIWIVTSLLILTYNMSIGKETLIFPADTPFYTGTKNIFLRVIPFSGTFSLAVYLFSSIPFINQKLSGWGLT